MSNSDRRLQGLVLGVGQHEIGCGVERLLLNVQHAFPTEAAFLHSDMVEVVLRFGR